MSFVPVDGPATFHPAEPARESTIEFTGGRRTIALPIRAALPVLSKARRREDAHPSVALLGGAALLASRFVADGKIAPVGGGVPGWRVDGLDARDVDSVDQLARARTYDDVDAAAAGEIVRGVLDAVADSLPRAAPRGGASPVVEEAGRHPVVEEAGHGRRPVVEEAGHGRRPVVEEAGHGRHPVVEEAGHGRHETFAARLRARVEERAARTARGALPELVRVSLRVEADEEELRGGAVRLVLQVHDERDPLHVCDAALLWTQAGDDATHGFGPRARVHASIALRGAAEVWPVLDRFLALSVPDQITLDGAEIGGLLEHVAALRDAHVDVHWPRSLGPELTTRAVLDRKPEPRGAELPLQDSPFAVDGLFAFSWQVALRGEPLTEEEMEQLATAASPVLKLRGAWTVVDPATAQRARKRLIRKATGVEALGAALSGVTELPAGAEGERDKAEVVVGASLLKVRERLLEAPTREPLPAPAGLRAELRDYQRHGLTWLADLTGMGLGACLADDMGLGKTITLISLHLHRLEQGLSGGGPTLVVCPASLLGNWEAEVERFAPGVPVHRFHGGARTLQGVDGGFVLTTYGTLRRSSAALAGVPWDLVVADEAQHVKNSRTSTARALRTIPSRGRVALTGTPVENELTELWSILDWCSPGLLGSRQAFRRVWAAPIEAGTDPLVAKQFADLIGPFVLRRRKSDPGIAPELPPKTETDHLLGLTREQVVLYEAFVRDTMGRIERLPGDDPQRRGLVLSLLTGLKQICNHPAQFLKQSGSITLRGRSEKLELLDELLDTVIAEDGAVLVFTQYVAMARLVEQHLAGRGVPHQFLHGGTPVPQREAMVRRFQAGEVPVFLLSLKAGGTGLNLTRADHVVHVDRWWNPAVEEQATDRAYRIGQTRPVQVHRMVTRGTIEEQVAALLERKRSLADAVLSRGDTALTELSNHELRDLVTLRRERQRLDLIDALEDQG